MNIIKMTKLTLLLLFITVYCGADEKSDEKPAEEKSLQPSIKPGLTETGHMKEKASHYKGRWGISYVGTVAHMYDVNLQYRLAFGMGYGLVYAHDGDLGGYDRISPIGLMLEVSPGISGGKFSLSLGAAQPFAWNQYFKLTYLRTWNDPYQFKNNAHYFGPEVEVGVLLFKFSLGYFKEIKHGRLAGDRIISYSIGMGLSF